jgi:hypothetical protein
MKLTNMLFLLGSCVLFLLQLYLASIALTLICITFNMEYYFHHWQQHQEEYNKLTHQNYSIREVNK